MYVMGWLVTLPTAKSMFLPMVGGRSTRITPASTRRRRSGRTHVGATAERLDGVVGGVGRDALDVDRRGANFELGSLGCDHAAAVRAVACRASAEAGKPFLVYRTAGIEFVKLILPSSSAGVAPLGYPRLDTLYQPTTTHFSLHIFDMWISSTLLAVANALHDLPYARSNAS